MQLTVRIGHFPHHGKDVDLLLGGEVLLHRFGELPIGVIGLLAGGGDVDQRLSVIGGKAEALCHNALHGSTFALVEVTVKAGTFDHQCRGSDLLDGERISTFAVRRLALIKKSNNSIQHGLFPLASNPALVSVR